MLAECALIRLFFFNLVWNLVSSFSLKSHIFLQFIFFYFNFDYFFSTGVTVHSYWNYC